MRLHTQECDWKSTRLFAEMQKQAGHLKVLEEAYARRSIRKVRAHALLFTSHAVARVQSCNIRLECFPAHARIVAIFSSLAVSHV